MFDNIILNSLLNKSYKENELFLNKYFNGYKIYLYYKTIKIQDFNILIIQKLLNLFNKKYHPFCDFELH